MNMNEIEGDYMSDKQESLLKLAELFKILGDPTRLKIVELLLENEMCVNHIAETMGMGQSAISHQLRVLRQARLVTYRKEGKTAYYSLNDDHVEGLVRMGMEHVSHQKPYKSSKNIRKGAVFTAPFCIGILVLI